MTEAIPGRFHRVDPTVVEDDPFWSVVRRRHPDVEIVLMPDDDPAPGPGAPVERVREEAVAAIGAWRLLRPVVLAVVDEPAEPSVRWSSRTAGDALVIEKAVAGIGQEDGTDLLRAVTVVLGRAGWRLRPTTRDGLPALDATNGRIDVRADAGPGATVLTIATGLMPVDADVRDAVAAGVREELSSWQ
ncbi:MAG: hypothetical protein NTX33_19655 [Propionibacteriales bacterium]|nr:hypothetical protein [Propionibacteriales bacterium]